MQHLNRPVLADALEPGQSDDVPRRLDDGGAADDEVGHCGHRLRGAHGGHAVLVAQPLPLGWPRHVVQLELVPLVPAKEVKRIL